MTLETQKKEATRKPLLPIRFTGLFGKRPVAEQPTQGLTPEPSKIEAPSEPTPKPDSMGRTYGNVATHPLSATKGVEQFKEGKL